MKLLPSWLLFYELSTGHMFYHFTLSVLFQQAMYHFREGLIIGQSVNQPTTHNALPIEIPFPDVLWP